MSITLGFDIYGTLIDPYGVTTKLAEYTEQSAEFSRIWRDKQLEYTFRRGLMRRYENFAVCTRNALDYTDSLLDIGLDNDAKQALIKFGPAFFNHITIAGERDTGIENHRPLPIAAFGFALFECDVQGLIGGRGNRPEQVHQMGAAPVCTNARTHLLHPALPDM